MAKDQIIDRTKHWVEPYIQLDEMKRLARLSPNQPFVKTALTKTDIATWCYYDYLRFSCYTAATAQELLAKMLDVVIENGERVEKLFIHPQIVKHLFSFQNGYYPHIPSDGQAGYWHYKNTWYPIWARKFDGCDVSISFYEVCGNKLNGDYITLDHELTGWIVLPPKDNGKKEDADNA